MGKGQGRTSARAGPPRAGAGDIVTGTHVRAGADRLAVWLAGLVALGVRILYLIESGANPFRTHLSLDPKYYHEWAQAILQGPLCGPDVFAQAPLYPYLLAGIYAVTGPDPLAPLWLQALLGAATAMLGASLAGRYFGPIGALATGLLLALYKPGIFYTGVLLVPVVATLLFAAALWLAESHPLLAGIAAGLTGLAHPVLLPGALLVTGVTAELPAAARAPGRPQPAGRSLRPALLVLAGTALAILPATVHNLACSGRFVPISANSGINLYIGNGPEANGFYASPDGLRAEQDLLGVREASDRAGRPLSTVESSRYWTGETLAEIHARPGKAAGLYLRKVYLTLFSYETPQVESLDFEKRFSTLLRVPLLPNWALLALLAGFALVLLRRSPRMRLWGAAVLLTALVIGVFFATGRFRFPMHLLLALMSGGGLAALAALLEGRELHVPGAGGDPAARALAAGAAGDGLPRGARLKHARVPQALLAAGLLAVLLVPNWLRVQKDLTYGQYHYRLGVVAEGDARIEEAQREYAAALAIDPTVARAAINLGILAARQGDLARAEPLLERGVQLDPRSARGRLSLGQIHQLRGDLSAACSLYAAAWEADTTFLRGLESWAAASYVRGEAAAAESLAAELIRRARGDPLGVRCQFLLERLEERHRYGWPAWVSRDAAEGDLALAVKDLAAAEERYRTALLAHPEDPGTLLGMIRIAALRGDAAEAARLAARYRAAGGPAAALAPFGLE